MTTARDGRAEKARPDVDSLDPSAFPQRALPPVRGRRPGFQAVARRSVLNDIYRHGHASPEVEVCGVLVGNVYRDAAGPFLYVEAGIRGEHASSQGAQVTFTPATWAHVQQEMEQRHPDKKILGWYHTHPGFGVFLSGMDLFIQENFFGLPWQTAYVYDPVSGEEGLFVWRQGAPVREAFLVEEDAVSEKRQETVRGSGAAESLAAERLAALQTQQRWLLLAAGVLAFLVLVWPIAWGSLTRPAGEDAAREWDQHFLLELGELRARTTELRGDVAELRGDVARLRLDVARLRQECDRRLPPLAEAPAEPPLPPPDELLLTLDGLPGPPRPLFTGMRQALRPPGEAKGPGAEREDPRPAGPGRPGEEDPPSGGND
jgi:proteasome lid subunit RPN8/RPN11